VVGLGEAEADVASLDASSCPAVAAEQPEMATAAAIDVTAAVMIDLTGAWCHTAGNLSGSVSAWREVRRLTLQALA
jgi:hypothetical protein